MPTFIDESGDAGPGKKSPRFFRLAAVWFEHDDHTAQYIESLRKVRGEILRLPQSFEFHYADNNKRQKSTFFDASSSHHFNFAFCSFDKWTFEPRSLTGNMIREATVNGLVNRLREWYLCAEACKDGASGLNERIVFDQCDDPNYVEILQAGFRSLSSGRGPNEKMVRSVKDGKSKVDPRLQLADMVCGAVGSYLDGEDAYYKIIKHKEIGIEKIVGK